MLFGLTPEQVLEWLAFLAATAVVAVSGLGVMFAPRVLHAAVWLLFCLLGVAGYYALLAGHVVFVIQVLVYAGGIAVMIIFAVLLLERGVGRGLLAGSRHLFAGLVAAGLVFIALAGGTIYAAIEAGHPRPALQPAEANAAEIGRLFLTRHIFAFEFISIVLLVALVGAIVLARPQRRSAQRPGWDDGNAGASAAASAPDNGGQQAAPGQPGAGEGAES